MSGLVRELPTSREAVLALAGECVAYIRRRNPCLRLLAVSGSLTRPEHTGVHEDADFFAVARAGRIWEAFFGCLLHGWRFARQRGLPRTFFCFNYLVDEAHPEEIDLSRAEYVREFLRLEVVVGHDYYRSLLERFRDRLCSADPDLYAAACRRAAEVAPPAAAEPAGAGGWSLLYRVFRLPFRLLACIMEARRRSRYPGGFIYSNARVIRSHFRRFWRDPVPDADGTVAAGAFTAAAPTYESRVARSPANRHMRSVVHAILAELIRPGMTVLDLGAGIGLDAVWLAGRGARVLAVDAAAGMVEEARRAVNEAGLAESVEVRRLAAAELGTLLPDHARRYDLVLANFGVLNLAGEPERWAPVLARLLKPGGRLVATVMNRFSLWELAAGLLRGRLSFALRRLRGDPIRVAGVPLAVSLYTPAGFQAGVSRWFRAESVRGLCTLVPPPDVEQPVAPLPRLWNLLCRLEERLAAWPVLRGAGDHFLAVLRQETQPLFRRAGVGSVTAAPVVADINGDGLPEVLVASNRLHLLTGLGRPLGGWPRRPGGPLASTPWVRQSPGGALIYIGSDDDRLYALTGSGAPVAGFPLQTGGDVFSSPLVAEAGEDGAALLLFGSDDGCLYAADLAGRPQPGWPLRTGGFVSASPVPARIAGRWAVVIGSWDGRLYAVDAYGKSQPGWPVDLGFPIWSSAAVADIDGDGEAEVLVAAQQIFALRGDGSALSGFPVPLGAYAVGSPAVGDLDGDGRLEVVVGADALYAWRADGTPLPGFPVDLGAYLWASPILLDVDGDGHPEVVAGDFAGRLWAVNRQGVVLSGYPVAAGRRIAAAPAAADLDGDGYLEIIVATTDGQLVVLPTECPDQAGAAPWPRFLHGRHATLDPSAAPGGEARRAGAPAGAAPAPRMPGATPDTRGAIVGTAAAPADLTFRLQPGAPLPFRVTEIHLGGCDRLRAAGMLHYTVNGTAHPSPLLTGGGRTFALVQPLPPLQRVEFWCELSLEDGGLRRYPSTGSLSFRVGVPGLRRSAP